MEMIREEYATGTTKITHGAYRAEIGWINGKYSRHFRLFKRETGQGFSQLLNITEDDIAPLGELMEECVKVMKYGKPI
jgi:hypothetical protein